MSFAMKERAADPIETLKNAISGLKGDFHLDWDRDSRGCVVIRDRSRIYLSDGKRRVEWTAGPLRLMFRGSKAPPSPEQMALYPEEYLPLFTEVESPLVMEAYHDADFCLTDAGFAEIFSAMRRRPDGKSVNKAHALVWQCAAFALAMFPWSEAEHTAVFYRLEKSARTFNMGGGSKNYLGYLRRDF
jgi:hypothetical protein